MFLCSFDRIRQKSLLFKQLSNLGFKLKSQTKKAWMWGVNVNYNYIYTYI